MNELQHHRRTNRPISVNAVRPPKEVEFGYYAVLIYGTLGVALGVSIQLLAAAMLATLAAICVSRLGFRATIFDSNQVLPIGCAVSFILLQLSLYGESFSNEYVRASVTYILDVVVIQSLSMRQEFLHRFSVVSLLLGIMTLPFLDFNPGNRAGLDLASGIGGLENSNEFGAYFGFCFVYLTVAGLETKRVIYRYSSWLAATGCLLVVGLTVSRGALLGSAIAITVACRSALRRAFVPVLLLLIFGWIVLESGLFGHIISAYSERGMEETGRLSVWPLAIERFLQSPLIGVGLADVATDIPGTHPITPHNSFLFLALSSGIVPLVLFTAYWWRTVRQAFRLNIQTTTNAPFAIPLLTYAFIISLQGNMPFTSPWAIATLSSVLAARGTHRVRRVAMRQIKRRAIVHEAASRSATRSSRFVH